MYIPSLVKKYDSEMNKWENEKMKNRNILIRCVLMLWMVCGMCHTAAFAYGYAPNAQSNNWGYQPVYQSTATTSYVSAAPTYQFRTTSAYISTSGASEPYNPMSGPSGPRRGLINPGADDNPIGEVPDPAPVGDTPWLLMLLLAAGYIAFRSIRRRVKRLTT